MEQQNYGLLVHCPFVVPRQPIPFADTGAEWSLFADLKQIAMNQPSTLTQRRSTKYTASIVANI